MLANDNSSLFSDNKCIETYSTIYFCAYKNIKSTFDKKICVKVNYC